MPQAPTAEDFTFTAADFEDKPETDSFTFTAEDFEDVGTLSGIGSTAKLAAKGTMQAFDVAALGQTIQGIRETIQGEDWPGTGLKAPSPVPGYELNAAGALVPAAPQPARRKIDLPTAISTHPRVKALAEDIAQRERKMLNIRQSPAMERWNQAEGQEAVKAFISDPFEVTANIVAQGLAGSLPGVLGAAVLGSAAGPIGTALGAGGGSFASEYTNKILSSLRESGVDLQDANQLTTALSDPERMAAIREKAVQRGVPVAVFDAVSGGIAGKLLIGAKGTRQAITRGAGEAGLQAGLGAGGELTGQLAAGEQIQPKEIFAEAIGELGPGAGEVAINTWQARRDLLPRTTAAATQPLVPETGKEPIPAAAVPEPVVPTATAAVETPKPAAAEPPAVAEPSTPISTTPVEIPQGPGVTGGPGAASPTEFTERETLDFTNEWLPDFIERGKEREVFSQRFGLGRLMGKIPILGRLIDPNAGVNSYEQQSLAAYNAASKGVGPAIASSIGTRFGSEIRNAFKADANGNLNIGRRTTGQSLKISDVFEALERNPNAYVLNAEQQQVWNDVLKPLLNAKRKLVQKYDLTTTEDAEGNQLGHFHRIVTEFPKGKEPLLKRIGQSVGARIPSQRGRVFTKSEQQGWEKGYKYELDPVKRLVSDIERTYKAIADKRLIEDEVFGGITKKQLESQLRETYADDLATGEMTERGFQSMLENRAAAGRVYQPGFSNTIFSPETAKLLNDTLKPGDSQLRKTIQTGNDFLKALRLGFDLGVGQIQLLPTFFISPKTWGNAQWQSLKAMLSKDAFGEYVRQHEQAVKELAQAGSSVGQLQEFMSGIAPGQALTRVPGVGRVAEAFGRQFQTALDVAKIQLWEAWREVTPPDQRLQVIRTLESQLSMGRMESIGVSGRQALIERVFLLAPSYYRGALNYIAAIAEPGVSGKIARRGLTAFIGGGLALFYGVGKALGMDDEELLKRLDPTRSDFMQWIGEGKDGRKINFGIGGIHRSLLRLAGNIIKTSKDYPENWKSLAVDKNPISRWLRGHSAPIPEAAFTLFSGRDFMGEEADIGSVTGTALPLTVQQLFRREGEPKVTMKELAFSFLGVNAYPESVSRQFVRERNTEAMTKHGKRYESLPLRQQVKISNQLSEKKPFSIKGTPTDQQIQRALERDVETRKRITSKLPESIQNNLRDSGVHVTSYEPSLKIGQSDFYLTRNQQRRYEELIVENYEKVLSKLKFERLSKAPTEQRQKLVSNILEDAKEKARNTLLKELR
jgi:hypothetical protein